MQNSIVNEEDFNHEIIGTNLKHISKSLPSVNDFKFNLPKGFYIEMDRVKTKKPFYNFSSSLIGAVKNIPISNTKYRRELSKNRANYFLQEMIYKNF